MRSWRHCTVIRFAGIRTQKCPTLGVNVRKFHPKLTFCIHKETVKNDKCVDPKGFIRPWPRVHHEEREKAILAREEERKKRRRLFLLHSNSNPRDLKFSPGGFKKWHFHGIIHTHALNCKIMLFKLKWYFCFKGEECDSFDFHCIDFHLEYFLEFIITYNPIYM